MVDNTIALQVRPFQMPDIGQIYGNVQNIQMNRMRMAEAQETAQERNALRGLLSSGVDPYSAEGLAQVRRAAPMLAAPFEAAAGQRAYQTAQAGRLRAQTEADAIKVGRDLFAAATTPEQYSAARAYVAERFPQYATAIPAQFSLENARRIAEGAEGLLRRATASGERAQAQSAREQRIADTMATFGVDRPTALGLVDNIIAVVPGSAGEPPVLVNKLTNEIVTPRMGAARPAAAPETAEAPAIDLRRPQAAAPAAPTNMMLPGATGAPAPTSVEDLYAARRQRQVQQAGQTAEAEARGRVAAPPAPRQDYRYTPGFERVEPIPGSPTERAEARRRESEARAGGVVLRELDRALELVDTARLPTAGLPGAVMSAVPGTAAADIRALLDTVRANIGFQQLNQMRQESPTGGALGNVTVREIEFLQAALGNLSQAQSPAQFRQNLLNLRDAYNEIVHGPQGGATAPRPAAPTAEPSRDQVPGPRRSTAPSAAPAAGARPTLEQFLTAARRANPNVSDDALTEYYNRTYGGR